ncbi:GNAT family N-acetyltransferase [Photobacterium salinisoli]|uniref:GNAT family N-acetyltransferase n=1 Tax=Photobacterium salinisoli TaxID=1616783 RepID=UPI000EA36853
MYIQKVMPNRDDVRGILSASDAYMYSLYPPETNNLESEESLMKDNVHLVGAFVRGALAGIGAVKMMDDDGQYGEIKRMFVLDNYRGLGISRQIMEALHQYLKHNGISIARLETGVNQPESIGLYQTIGYRVCEPYGQYQAHPLSIFMELDLNSLDG